MPVKANQPGLRAEVESCFEAATPGSVQAHTTHDKSHGRIEQRTVSVVREIDWLSGDHRFPGELRLPEVACTARVQTCVERGGKNIRGDPLLHLLGDTGRRTGRPGVACTGCWT
jgi:hypothetical protein